MVTASLIHFHRSKLFSETISDFMVVAHSIGITKDEAEDIFQYIKLGKTMGNEWEDDKSKKTSGDKQQDDDRQQQYMELDKSGFALLRLNQDNFLWVHVMPAQNKDRGHIIYAYHCWIIPISVIMQLNGNWVFLADTLNQQHVQRKFEQLTPNLEQTILTIEPLTPAQEKVYISTILREPNFQKISMEMFFRQSSFILQGDSPLYVVNTPLSANMRLKWVQLITFMMPTQMRHDVTFATATFDNPSEDIRINMPYKPMSHFYERHVIFNWLEKELRHWKPVLNDGYLWAMKTKGLDSISEMNVLLWEHPIEDKIRALRAVCYRLWAEYQVANGIDNWDVLYEVFRDDVTLSNETSSQILMLLINAYFSEMNEDEANQAVRLIYEIKEVPCEIWLKAMSIKSDNNLFASPSDDTDYQRRYNLLKDLFQIYRYEQLIPYLNETIEGFSTLLSQTAMMYSKKRLISEDVRNHHVLKITQFMMKLINDILLLKMRISTTPLLKDFENLENYKASYHSLETWLVLLDLLNADATVQPFSSTLIPLKKLNSSAKGKMKHLAISEKQIKDIADEFWKAIFGS